MTEGRVHYRSNRIAHVLLFILVLVDVPQAQWIPDSRLVPQLRVEYTLDGIAGHVSCRKGEES